MRSGDPAHRRCVGNDGGAHPMNLNQVTAPCADLDASVAFYRRLGLRLIVHDPPDYARFECPVGDSTFSLHRVPQVPAAHGIVVYFELDDLDAKVQQLEAEGLSFESGPRDQPWLWREAHLFDPAGNRVCLFHAGENRHNPPWRLREDA
jgi:catechol 2,3-dioxygenase-like lactoylglutathione lyase family enzyme